MINDTLREISIYTTDYDALKALAEAQGRSLTDVLHDVVQEYAVEQDDDDMPYEDDDETIIEGIRQGFRDAFAGRTYPIESLWEELDKLEDE